MPWTPTDNVIDETVIRSNLKTYLSAQQTDALTWAGGATDFAQIYSSAAGRLASIFPHLMIVGSNSEEAIDGDVLQSAVAIRLEGVLTGPNPDAMITETDIYITAVKSMLRNIPISTLTSGAISALGGNCDMIQTEMQVLRGQKGSTAFMQVFQISVVYNLVGSAQ